MVGAMENVKVIDGTDAVIGRLGAQVAKALLAGEKIAVVNAEKMVISGDPVVTTEKYYRRRLQKEKANPEHSPHWPRRPDLMAKRILRGMLPYKMPRGRRAFGNLKVYIGVPPELSANVQKPGSKTRDELHSRFITIAELCGRLGYNR